MLGEMTSRYRYRVVDVFTRRPLEGNPLAVFPDASGIDETTMQAIARELNLSETAFVLPATRPDCAARVRIFTPTREMTFAGHPTIGAAWVLLQDGIVPAGAGPFVLEEKVGPVPVRVDPGDPVDVGDPLIWLVTPPILEGRTYHPEVCARALGLRPEDLLAIAPQWLSAGNPTIFVGLRDKAAVDRAWLDLAGMKMLHEVPEEPVCVLVFAPAANGAYARMFAPEYGITEDPASGSSTGPLAAYMMRHDLAPAASGTRWTSEQGTRMGRRSILHVQILGARGAEGIEVGGYVAPLVEAVMTWE